MYVYSVERSKHILKLSSPSGSHNIFRQDPRYQARRMQVGYEKIAIFDQYLVLSRVVNAVTVRCYRHSASGPWQVGETRRW